MSAVYAIFCKPAGKYYVGSTTRLATRLQAQRSALRMGKHACRELQADWERFGESAFDFVTLESVRDRADLSDREKYYISVLDCYKTMKVSNNNAYNGKTYVSDKMRAALALIQSGATAYSAAKSTGIAQSTISRSRIYRDWLAAQKKPELEKKKFRFE